MAMLIENSAPAMHEESQLFSVPVSFTERWRTETERMNPTTVLTDDGATGDIFSFHRAAMDFLIWLTSRWN